MTGKEFFGAVTNGQVDMVDLLLELLHTANAPYAVVGGLAVNAYAEPVVSLEEGLAALEGDARWPTASGSFSS